MSNRGPHGPPSQMTAERAIQLSNTIIAMLPDDKDWAMTVIATAFATVSRATDTTDDGAIKILRVALRATKPVSSIIRPEL